LKCRLVNENEHIKRFDVLGLCGKQRLVEITAEPKVLAKRGKEKEMATNMFRPPENGQHSISELDILTRATLP